MTTSTHRIVVVLKLPTNVPGLIKTGESITAAVLGNAYFGTLQSLLPGVNAKIAALDSAETAAKTRAKGTIAARNNARNDVVTALHALKAGVQAAADADPEHAEAIAASAGMTVRKVAVRVKAPFAVKAGAVSGSAHLAARASARRASYEWQWSGDGGKTWNDAPGTLQAKTTISGLPVATLCQFRYRAITKAGEGDWSQVVTLVVK